MIYFIKMSTYELLSALTVLVDLLGTGWIVWRFRKYARWPYEFNAICRTHFVVILVHLLCFGQILLRHNRGSAIVTIFLAISGSLFGISVLLRKTEIQSWLEAVREVRSAIFSSFKRVETYLVLALIFL